MEENKNNTTVLQNLKEIIGECDITMKEFSAGEKSTDSKFLKDNGFMNLTSCFYLKRKLYENKITLTVTIEKETKEVLVEVYDEILKHVYIPFYNREYNQNNQVLDEVLKKYKSIIKDLENKKILTIE